jgi:hypothetical protein
MAFGDVADPGIWSRIHDETLENIANIRVPVIAAVEGRAHIHSDYALLASVIVAAEGATRPIDRSSNFSFGALQHRHFVNKSTIWKVT